MHMYKLQRNGGGGGGDYQKLTHKPVSSLVYSEVNYKENSASYMEEGEN